MEFINGIKMDIILEQDESSNELVVICAGATRVKLTPQQARMLATKLVMAVSRAEVHGRRGQETAQFIRKDFAISQEERLQRARAHSLVRSRLAQTKA